MQDLSELDDLVRDDTATAMVGLEKTMADFYELTKQYKDIATRLKDMKEIISAEADEEPGEYEVVAGGYVAKVKRPEKYTWDDAILESLVGGVTLSKGGIPDAVSTQIKVNKDKYDALPAHEKALLSPALTVGPGADRVTVFKKGENDNDED